MREGLVSSEVLVLATVWVLALYVLTNVGNRHQWARLKEPGRVRLPIQNEKSSPNFGKLATGKTAVRLVLFAAMLLSTGLVLAEGAKAPAMGDVSAASGTSTGIGLEISHIGDATHFEFSGSADWKYEMKKGAVADAKVANSVATLRLSGLQPAAIAKLRSLDDTLVRSVKVNEHGIDNSVELTFSLGPSTDFFDYISDQPSRLIVDFFPAESAKNSPVPLQKPSPHAVQTADPAKALPVKHAKSLQPKAAKSVRSEASVDDGNEDETEDEARAPASDGLLVAKGELPAAPSLAERLSSQKDFDHGIFDGGDPEFRRFSLKDYEIKEDAILASKANFYLPFPMLELGTPQLKALIGVPPSYEIVANDTRENKEARVLLKLFSENDRALFLKAADEFVNEHPTSNYDELIRYMVADTHYDIYRASNSVQDFETAMDMYLFLTEKYPSSPMEPRTLLLMGYSYLDRGDSFGALKVFQRFQRLHPDSKHIDRVNISVAEAYLRLNRFDDAAQLFSQIEKSGTTAHGREEAAFHRGDVFFRRRDYPGAISEYKAAMQKYPTAASRFPNAYYNLAEAQFVQNQFRDSLESYRIFLRKFPDHDHGGYAMTRMGELLGILGADSQRVSGAFMESYFRYRSTPGAGVARIRMLTTRMADMKDKELTSALHEIGEITEKYSNRPRPAKPVAEVPVPAAAPASHEGAPAAGHGEAAAGEHGGAGGHAAEPKVAADPGALRLIPKENEEPTKRPAELPGIEEFAALLVADGYTSRYEYDDSLKGLISFYQKNPQSPNKDKFKIRINRNISAAIKASVNKGDFIDGLRRYSKNADGWLKNTDRVDVKFSVGRAYEEAGVFKEAKAYYTDCVQRLKGILGTPAEREHKVFESLPKLDSVELRLAAVAAKANDFAGAESHLKNISDGAQMVDAEQIERAEVSAQVAEARGRPEIARKYLTELVNVWKGDAQLTSPLHLRLARLQSQSGNDKVADAHLQKIINWKKEANSRVPDAVHAKALEARADLYLRRGKRSDAIKTYRELLADYETTRPLESVRYRLGQILYQDGDLKAAENEWAQLKTSKDGLWQRLASEQMQGAKWQNEYKKYLNRIPAAADLRDGKSSGRDGG